VVAVVGVGVVGFFGPVAVVLPGLLVPAAAPVTVSMTVPADELVAVMVPSPSGAPLSAQPVKTSASSRVVPTGSGPDLVLRMTASCQVLGTTSKEAPDRAPIHGHASGAGPAGPIGCLSFYR